MELNLDNLLNDMVHVPGFGGDDTDVLELDAVFRMDVVPHHGLLVRMFKTDISVVLLNPGGTRASSLSYVDLTTPTWNSVQSRSLRS
jgi:hypothetical protein